VLEATQRNKREKIPASTEKNSGESVRLIIIEEREAYQKNGEVGGSGGISM